MSGVLRGQVTGPIPAADGKAMETIVPVNLGSKGWNAAGPPPDSFRAIATAGANGMTVHIAGPLGTAADSSNAFKGIDSTLLFAALAVVIVILLITYRSPVLWLLPVISAGVALATAQGSSTCWPSSGLTVNAQSAGILDVLVFGAGTDYALLLTARYREELRRHEDRHAAMAVALRRAGPAVVASGGTVILSLLTLSLAELNSTKSLGPVLAIGVAVALAAMLTLLPALLVITGRWVFWPVKPSYGSAEPTTRGFWARVGRRIAVSPRIVWVATVIVLAAMAAGVAGLQAHGLTNAQSFRGHPDSVAGQTVLDQHFPGGAGQPVEVFGNPASGPQLAAALRSVNGLTAVTPPVVLAGHAYLEATLTSAPDSQAAYATIDSARAAVHAVPGAGALVGGNTAVNLDVQRATAHDRNLIIPIILLVVFVILTLLLRALVAPLMLIATVVLSFAAALGVSALFFDNVFNFGGADTSFPLFVFVFLVALGIDYNIFLMTRVREEALAPRTALRRPVRPGRDRRRDHLGGLRARGHVRRARHAAGDVPDRARLRRGVRGAAGHDRGPLGAGDRAQPGPGPVALVAEQAGTPARAGGELPALASGRCPRAAQHRSERRARAPPRCSDGTDRTHTRGQGREVARRILPDQRARFRRNRIKRTFMSRDGEPVSSLRQAAGAARHGRDAATRAPGTRSRTR